MCEDKNCKNKFQDDKCECDQKGNARHWCFTWSNYTEKDIENLGSLKDSDKIRYLGFGKEICPTTGTPHLQGYLSVAEKPGAISMVAAKKLLDKDKGKASPIHLAKRIAAIEDRSIDYCKKGFQSKEEWKELGPKGPNFGKDAEYFCIVDKRKNKKTGNDKKREADDKTAKFLACEEFIRKEGATFKEVLKKFPDIAIPHHAGIEKAITIATDERNKKGIREELEKITLRPWQKQLCDELEGEPDRRKIIWYVDKKGGEGKSMLSQLLQSQEKAECFSNGKSCDIAHAYKGSKVVIFDYVRSLQEMINYGIIEQVKNGMVFSPKYNSNTKMFRPPHVVVFSNQFPNKNKMSLDRWDIRIIENGYVVNKISFDDKGCPATQAKETARGNTGIPSSLQEKIDSFRKEFLDSEDDEENEINIVEIDSDNDSEDEMLK